MDRVLYAIVTAGGFFYMAGVSQNGALFVTFRICSKNIGVLSGKDET